MPEWYEISVGAVALDHAWEACASNEYCRRMAESLRFDPALGYRENLAAFRRRFGTSLRGRQAWTRFSRALREGVGRGVDLKYGPAAYGDQSGRERDWAFGGKWPAFLEAVLSELAVDPGTIVLDVGLNDGREVAHLPNPVYGVDASETALTRGRALHPRIRFLAGGAENLPLPDESVGLYMALRTFVDKIDLGRALSEAWRVLTPGGGFLVSAPTGHLTADGQVVVGLTRDCPFGLVVSPERAAATLTALKEALLGAHFVLLAQRESPLEVFFLGRKTGDKPRPRARRGSPSRRGRRPEYE